LHIILVLQGNVLVGSSCIVFLVSFSLGFQLIQKKKKRLILDESCLCVWFKKKEEKISFDKENILKLLKKCIQNNKLCSSLWLEKFSVHARAHTHTYIYGKKTKERRIKIIILKWFLEKKNQKFRILYELGFS
jgi:hypothetical protein